MKLTNLKLGVLGGGQLGRMLLNEVNNWGLTIHIMDPDSEAPCADICRNFTVGDLEDPKAVVAFGKNLDVLTIEIEKVSVAGLRQLKEAGVRIIPDPEIIAMIQDKAAQKEFLKKHSLPTSNFSIYTEAPKDNHAFVQKLRFGGYDGQGVQIIRGQLDYSRLFSAPSIMEDLVDIEKEFAVMVARNQAGEIAIYDPVEMHMDPELNLVDYLFAPSSCSPEQLTTIRKLAIKVAEDTKLCGILAIELFLTKSGEILINEMSPRPHNSGHHTIEACSCSQYQQLLRCLLNLPLGATKLNSAAVMINLIGADGYRGTPDYQNIDQLNKDGEYLHLYGKKQTRPGRKMGHITILSPDLTSAIQQAKILKSSIKVQA